MRGALVALLVLGLLLSGCTEKAKDDVVAALDEVEFAPAPTNTTTAPQPVNAAPIIANFTSNATGLNVTFAFAATDADADNLTYTLVFGGNLTNATGALANGTANVTQVFPAVGAYNVTLLVSDGVAIVNQTLNVTLLEAFGSIEQELSCTAMLGAAGVSGGFGPIQMGGCNLGATSGDGTLLEIDVSSACNLEFDANGDSQSDGDAVIGTAYESGTTFTAFCDPTMTPFSMQRAVVGIAA